ncbi:hypothetical protein Tdes44962_MAKER05755 [Teratosphaeria destructans]|uniref:DnaJ homologue subfamily C member 28 conserved domain-containing protein n=1 Tax=Teratosphaeria destructans TaxID=418781 RepID=A0A9W7SJ22_9PEZI|nr:hypothetical protein Tdes44962_MAKER05755 [Teratosphaeria destructans]
MQSVRRPSPSVCARCLRVSAQPVGFGNGRYASDTASPPGPEGASRSKHDGDDEGGAFSRRMAQMSEEALETGGRSAQTAVREAGFSDDLKRELEEKIANAAFRSEHASAFAQANLPASAGKQTRDIAGARAWTGEESLEDAALRMLNDAHKPLRVPARPPRLGPSARAPKKVDTGRPTPGATGARLANARDRTSAYAFMKDPNMSEAERERLREEMKARFRPEGRIAPATVQGLANLANQRIEDAIGRGQFKNLPRGPGKLVERDYNASSPFIDTTEYFMNKMIQKQEIVPPWIEKQQELVSTANRFRSRLRADWRRHVSRSIASRGGSLEQQIRLAEAYAAAEARENPRRGKEETVHTVGDAGQVSQITLAGELKATPVTNPNEPTSSDGSSTDEPTNITTHPIHADGSIPPSSTTPPLPLVPPFRDPDWLATETPYLHAAIANLNTLARSYNLMAPALAKKPYYALDRELRACYADVAPSVPAAMRERARRRRRGMRGATAEGRSGRSGV